MSPRLRVCYGGTFDPVHDGHLAIARAARDMLDADVSLLPARDPPHKAETRADAAQRAAMLALAIAGEQGLALDLRELGREGPSYTVDTLSGLRAELGDAVPIARSIATLLARRLASPTPTAFGELLPLIRRQLLREGHIGILAVVGFGDGDWLLGGQ